jgi:hypothetical protein
MSVGCVWGVLAMCLGSSLLTFDRSLPKESSMIGCIRPGQWWGQSPSIHSAPVASARGMSQFPDLHLTLIPHTYIIAPPSIPHKQGKTINHVKGKTFNIEFFGFFGVFLLKNRKMGHFFVNQRLIKIDV